MKASIFIAAFCLAIGLGVRSMAQNVSEQGDAATAYSEGMDQLADQYDVQYDAQHDLYQMVPRPGGGGFHPGGGPGVRPGPGPGFRPGPVGPGFRPGPGPGFRPGPVGPGFRPGPGGPGFRPGFGGGLRPGFVPGWHPGFFRPGWYPGWVWNPIAPFWWPIAVAPFVIYPYVPMSYWQCTAYDQGGNAYTSSAPSEDQAAYNAMYDCGGDNAQDLCYIPDGYCGQRLQ